MTLFTQNCENRLHKKMFSPDDEKTNTYVSQQNMNNLPSDMLLNVLSFLGNNEKIKNRSINKEFNKQVTTNIKRKGYNYDNPDLQKFQKFIKSDMYNYCKKLIMPSGFNQPIILPPNLHTFIMGDDFK